MRWDRRAGRRLGVLWILEYGDKRDGRFALEFWAWQYVLR